MIKVKGVIFASAVLLFVLSRVVASSRPDVRRFESKKFGYTVEYPSDWHLQSLSDVFSVENFPPSKAVRGVRLPSGGAGIVIAASSQGTEEGPQRFDDWVKIGTAHQNVQEQRAFELQENKRTISITEVRADCCGVPPFLQYIEWFFQIDGHFFQASLVLWQGDPKADQLQETLKRVVLSVKVSRL